jgi:6,7-dimethyl-8-ribityllumazine synthase
MTSSDETVLDPTAHGEFRSRVGVYLDGPHDGTGMRIGIACGRFNGGISTRLLTHCLDALQEAGVASEDIAVAWAPGAFELPLLARAFALSPERYDAVITLGAVIRGDTGHYEVVAGECARGVQDVQLSTGVPVVFGVLTTNTVEQALERSRNDATNKGRESAETAIAMAHLLSHAPFAS